MTTPSAKFKLQILPTGERRSKSMNANETILADEMGRRVAPFDTVAAQFAAQLMALWQKKRRPVELRDMMIAGIVLACHATHATRNTPHFENLSVPVINPWVI